MLFVIVKLANKLVKVWNTMRNNLSMNASSRTVAPKAAAKTAPKGVRKPSLSAIRGGSKVPENVKKPTSKPLTIDDFTPSLMGKLNAMKNISREFLTEELLQKVLLCAWEYLTEADACNLFEKPVS